MDKNSWFTPKKYIYSVNAVLGLIGLDPFSCREANETVKAFYYFSENKINAFNADWNYSTVFMNPPYSNGLYGKAVDKFILELEKHGFEAITLTNNNTETIPSQKLYDHANAVCLTDHRIQFYNVDGKKVSNNMRGQVFCYFGDNEECFKDEFSKHGIVFTGKQYFMDYDFLEYLEQARTSFVKHVSNQTWNTEFRMEAENMLIAYDQMFEKLKNV